MDKSRSRMIVGIQDIHYGVVQMDRAVAFYRDVLGMQVLDSNADWTSLDCFGARFGLRKRSSTALKDAALTLRSTDLDADLAHLRRNGVAIVSTADHPWGRVAVFTDTEGNALELMQAPA